MSMVPDESSLQRDCHCPIVLAGSPAPVSCVPGPFFSLFGSPARTSPHPVPGQSCTFLLAADKVHFLFVMKQDAHRGGASAPRPKIF